MQSGPIELRMDGTNPTVEETLFEAIKDYEGEPSALLECMYYAKEPYFLQAMRLIASLPNGRRLKALKMLGMLVPEHERAIERVRPGTHA